MAKKQKKSPQAETAAKPKRLLLTDRQVNIVLKDLHEFGYKKLTFEEVRTIADQIAAGTWNYEDVVARIIVNQIDEAVGAPK